MRTRSSGCFAELNFWVPLSRFMRIIKRILATKIITRIDRKLQDESIKSN
jgi:hypothetical protein